MSKTTRDEQNAQSSENLSAEQGAQTSQSSAAQGTQAQITPLPTPPTSADSASFNERADNFLLALPRFANELNAFGQAVGDETKERIESTIKSSIDTRLNENEVRLKKELVDEVASQTSGLKRASVRLLNIPCYDYSQGIDTPKGLAGLNYQLVTRQNDEQHDSEIVDYGDVFVSIYKTWNFKYAFRGITRLCLPRTVGELENYHIRTSEGRVVANYFTDPQNAGETHIDGAESKDVIEGDTVKITKSAVGINGAVSMSAAWGVCEWVKDKDEYKFSYRAHLINEPRKDVITLKLGSVEEKINIFIKKRTHTLTKEQEAQRCQWSKVEGNGRDFICWCEQMSDTVLVFGNSFWLTNSTARNQYQFLDGAWNHGLKFSFPCEVAEIYAPFGCVMVLLKDGSLWHLGNNANYEAGLGNTTHVQYFTKNPTLKKVQRLFFSQDFVPTNLGLINQTNTPKSVNFFALCEENKLYAWGANTSGCLGLGDTSVKTTPQLVNEKWETQIKDICAFANFTHLLLENGKLLRAGLPNHTAVADPKFKPMLYYPKVWKWVKGSYDEIYNGEKGLWQADNDTTQTKAFEKVKAIFKNCTQNNLYNWALQLESGELCYDIYSFGQNYADNENWQDSPPYRPMKSFGWDKDLGMSEICDVQTAGRVLAFARNSKLYYVRWGMCAPVAQSLGEFGGGDLSYDYNHIDFGLKNELLQWQITTAPIPAISCFVIKNKEMGRDDLLIYNGDLVFHKVAY